MTSNPEMIVRDIRIIVMILYRVSCTAFQADFAIPRHSGVDGRFTKVRLGGWLRSRDNLNFVYKPDVQREKFAARCHVSD